VIIRQRDTWEGCRGDAVAIRDLSDAELVNFVLDNAEDLEGVDEEETDEG